MLEPCLWNQNPRPVSPKNGEIRTGHPRIFVLTLLVMLSLVANAQEPLGIFENHSDVGIILHPGSARFDAAKQTYTLTGSGENMWSTADAFQFVWKKMSGDVELTADISFANSAGNPHKKAVLIFRQSPDADAVYADIALHGNGLAALQYRDEKGGITHEIQSTMSARIHAVTKGGGNEVQSDITTARLRLTRRGDNVYMSVGATPHYDGESYRVPLNGAFYVGIGVCAHNKDAVEQATFSNVEVRALVPPTGQPVLYSTLETIAVTSTDRTAIYFAPVRFEAPNWSRDGSYFLFNQDGHLQKLRVTGGKPEVLNTGLADRLNNDHGISPDTTELAISDNSQEKHDSLVYIVPITGGTPRRITKNSPSYWHGWSPDGKTLAFVGQRDGEFDIYTIPAAGGDETRLTTAKGLELRTHRTHADLAHEGRR
jgi:TolB protein